MENVVEPLKKYYIFKFRLYEGEIRSTYSAEMSFKPVEDYVTRDPYGKIRNIRVCVEENDPYKATAKARELLKKG